MSISTPAAAAAWLIAIAENSDSVDAIVQSGEAHWSVLLSDDRSLLIEWLDEPPRLFFSAAVGTPPAAREFEVLRTAMSYNAMWRETGGIQLAQGGDRGEMLMHHEVQLTSNDEANGQAELENFAALQAWWSFYCTSVRQRAEVPFDLQTITMRI